MSACFISTNNAPTAIGPYSQAVRAGGLVFVSGQIPFDIEKGQMIEDIEEATRLVLSHIEAIVTEAGGSKEDIVKVNVYMKDLSDFPLMNAVYEKFFGSYKPARAAVEVSRLPKEAVIEMEAIANVE